MDDSRREFLRFMGHGIAAATALSFLPHCTTTSKSALKLPFTPLKPTKDDTLSLANGFTSEILLKWRQPLNAEGDLFGFNNDYLAYVPLDPKQPLEGLLWVNHEYHDPYLNSGWRPGHARTLDQINIERKEVGGSIVHIGFVGGRWMVVSDSKYNQRLDAFTPIPFVSDRPIMGKRLAVGTFGNCAGGVTSWGTVLTCEENYQNFVGEAAVVDGKRVIKGTDEYLNWTPHIDLPPEHYGWVVEVDPKTAQAKKLTALGRFCHECATTTLAKDGRTVVYTGDDTENEHLYKFIAARPGSLDKGQLYVADTVKGKWLLLDRNKDPRLRKAFKDQTELLIQTRQAAKIVGATELDRPEDIEIDPKTGAVIVSLSLNKKRGNFFGSLMKIEEKNGNPLSLEFQASTFKAGGPETGFSCPDNLVFDKLGNLWMCTDISGSAVHRDPYVPFGNNGLFYIPLSGPAAGIAMQVAAAPVGAELTGPCFAPDGSLLLSVQHPGERSHDPKHFPSHWPEGGNKDPYPCVVQIQGPMLQKLVNG
jgi:uncharacterized protein